MAFAILVLLFGVLLLCWLEAAVIQPIGERTGLTWLSDHVALPLLRIAVLLAFIASAYPHLFGASPGLPAVLAADSQRISHLINLAFVAGLLLPLLPMFNRLPAPVATLQAILAITLLFSWTADALQADVSLVPHPGALLVCAGLSIAGFLLCRWGFGRLPGPLNEDTLRGAFLLDGLPLLGQVPAIWYYAHQLGQQIR